MNDRIRQRWRDRRHKNYNWKKLIIMGLALLMIIIAMNELGKREKTVFQTDNDSVRTEMNQNNGEGQ